jgi:hypothetical protein
MILRDVEGQIIVSACKLLNPCQSPLEAELEACRDGLALALEWSTLPCTVELDSSVAVKMIQSPELDRSLFAGIVQDIKQLLSSRCNMELVCISRVQNNVSHALANFGRTQAHSQTWSGSGPVDIPALCWNDCNLVA